MLNAMGTLLCVWANPHERVGMESSPSVPWFQRDGATKWKMARMMSARNADLQKTHITMCGLTSRADGMPCVLDALNEITLLVVRLQLSYIGVEF